MRLLFKATMLPTTNPDHELDLDLDEYIGDCVEAFEQWYERIGGQKSAPVLSRILNDAGEALEDDDAVMLLAAAYTKPSSVDAFRWMIRGLDWVEYNATHEDAARAIFYTENVSDSFDGNEEDLTSYEVTENLSEWARSSAEETLEELKDQCDGRVEDHVDWGAVLDSLVEDADEDNYEGKYVIDGNTYYVRSC